MQFACIDPSAACVDDDDITADLLEVCNPAHGIGNGRCEMSNNIEECGRSATFRMSAPYH